MPLERIPLPELRVTIYGRIVFSDLLLGFLSQLRLHPPPHRAMFSKVIIALHVVLTLVILAVTVRILQDDENEKKGIVEILVRNS